MTSILDYFRQIIQDSAQVTVLECGVCDGYHSNMMLEIIKASNHPFIFHGFEPNADLHPHILNNLKGHIMNNTGVISVFPHAVGGIVGEMTFWKSGGVKMDEYRIVDRYYGSSSIRKPKLIRDDYPEMTFVEEKVFVTTLDYHCRQHDIPQIDFIWADIQGAELDMIAGGKDMLAKTRYLYTEFLNREHYEGQGTLDDILTMLPSFDVIENYGSDVLLKNRMVNGENLIYTR